MFHSHLHLFCLLPDQGFCCPWLWEKLKPKLSIFCFFQIRWTKTAGSVSDRFQDSSVFNETLHIGKILRTQGGRYYCKAENGLGSPAIKSIRVDVYCESYTFSAAFLSASIVSFVVWLTGDLIRFYWTFSRQHRSCCFTLIRFLLLFSDLDFLFLLLFVSSWFRE